MLREAGDVAQSLAPGVVCIECQSFGKPTLEGCLQTVVVRYALTRDIANVTQIGKLGVEPMYSSYRIGWAAYRSQGVERRGLVDVVDRFRQMLADVTAIADSMCRYSSSFGSNVFTIHREQGALGGGLQEATAGGRSATRIEQPKLYLSADAKIVTATVDDTVVDDQVHPPIE